LSKRDVAGGVLIEQRIEEQRPLFEIGKEFGTSATSSRRRAPSSLSSTFFKTSSPRAAFASTMRPASNQTQ